MRDSKQRSRSFPLRSAADVVLGKRTSKHGIKVSEGSEQGGAPCKGSDWVSLCFGILLYAGAKRSRIMIFATGAILVALSMLLVPTLGYYPVLFGIAGGLILFLFLAVLWYWGRNRRSLDSAARTASDLQMASYVFFFVAASMLCSTLGNPFSGLYFPDKVLQDDALPWHYAMGVKIVGYFILGFLFNLLSQYVSHKHRRQQSAIL